MFSFSVFISFFKSFYPSQFFKFFFCNILALNRIVIFINEYVTYNNNCTLTCSIHFSTPSHFIHWLLPLPISFIDFSQPFLRVMSIDKGEKKQPLKDYFDFLSGNTLSIFWWSASKSLSLCLYFRLCELPSYQEITLYQSVFY